MRRCMWLPTWQRPTLRCVAGWKPSAVARLRPPEPWQCHHLQAVDQLEDLQGIYMNTSGNQQVLMPGEWLGMLGGGQLGRMFCHAAQRLGYKVAVLDPDPLSPAGAVAELHIQAAYDDVT